MKKIISIVLGVVLLLGAVALTSSCKKDIANAKSLVGSTWTGKDGTDIYTLTFPSSTDFRIVLNGSNFVVNGTFIITGEKPTLTGSDILLTPNAGIVWADGETDPISGVFVSESLLQIYDEKMTFERVVK